MSEYNPVFEYHYLKEVNDYRQYLPSKIQNEFTHILEKHVKENSLDQIRKANYFAIICHTDQMSIICRYFVVDDKVGVRESFLGFITKHGKIGYDKMILGRLEKEKLV